MKYKILRLVLSALLIFSASYISAQDAKEIVKKAEAKYNGEESSYSEMRMTIERPKYKRDIEFKSWYKSTGESLTYITAPAKEKGQSFLKI